MKQFSITNVFLATIFIGVACSNTDPITNGQPSVFTEIGGSISGVLEFRNSPFHVIESLLVEADCTLTIEPKVRLLFSDSTMLLVEGGLICAGDSGRATEFTAFENQWWGIKFVNSNFVSKMRFCKIEKVKLQTKNSLKTCAIEVINSQLTLQNSVIRNNSSIVGGGLYAEGSQVTITNNIFRNNSAENFGGALLCSGSQSDIINNTFYENRSSNFGGGLVLINPLLADVQNNIFLQNSNLTGDPRISLLPNSATGLVEQFNFLDPGAFSPFVSSQDLHLRAGSVAIDAGNPASQFNDFDGTRNDQGAYGGPLGKW